MTENKRFTHKKWYNERQLFDGDEAFAIVDVYIQAEHICDKLNALYEENKKQKTRIKMLENQFQRQINRNERLHKDWDRLYQHLADSGLMTEEEILKVIE